MTIADIDRSIKFNGRGGADARSGRRVRVDPRLCEGRALCIDLAPDVFDLPDDDVATCDAQPPHDLLDNVFAGVNACPRGAITVETT